MIGLLSGAGLAFFAIGTPLFVTNLTLQADRFGFIFWIGICLSSIGACFYGCAIYKQWQKDKQDKKDKEDRESQEQDRERRDIARFEEEKRHWESPPQPKAYSKENICEEKKGNLNVTS